METPSEFKHRILVGVSYLTLLIVLIFIVVFGIGSILSEGNDQPEQQEQAQAEAVEQESQRFELNEISNMTYKSSAFVVKDSETGVQYLFVGSGAGGGLTVLVDQDGKPLIEAGGGDD